MADITNADLTALQNPYAEQLVGLNRQQALAQALLQQGQQPPQGQMISGRYVKPSPLQNVNNLLQTAVGLYGQKQAENKQLELANLIRQKEGEAVNAYTSAKTPQEQFAAATSQYAPSYLKSAATEFLKPQKLGEGETISRMNFNTNQFEPMAQGGIKVAPEVRQAMQLLGINKSIDQLNPQELQAVNQKTVALKQAGANVMNVNMGQHGFENTLKLGENFKNEPIYKTHQEINQAYKQVISSLDKNNAVGDYAAAVKISKLLDPNSVVRESEVATVANATGLVDKLSNYANKIAKGESLNPEQRTEYRQLAKDFYKISGEQFNETRNKYAQIGQQNKLEGTETILGAPWKAPAINSSGVTTNMQNANKILGIPDLNGGK
jgi:hypothetical protein